MKVVSKLRSSNAKRLLLVANKTRRTASKCEMAYGLYLDRDRRGNTRIALTLPRKGKRGGRRLRTLSGENRNIAYPYISDILFINSGRRLIFDSKSLRDEYREFGEEVGIQIRLLMEAVRSESDRQKAVELARAIAAMNYCEAAWWHAHHRSRSRPERVLEALALMQD